MATSQEDGRGTGTTIEQVLEKITEKKTLPKYIEQCDAGILYRNTLDEPVKGLRINNLYYRFTNERNKGVSQALDAIKLIFSEEITPDIEFINFDSLSETYKDSGTSENSSGEITFKNNTGKRKSPNLFKR